MLPLLCCRGVSLGPGWSVVRRFLSCFPKQSSQVPWHLAAGRSCTLDLWSAAQRVSGSQVRLKTRGTLQAIFEVACSLKATGTGTLLHSCFLRTSASVSSSSSLMLATPSSQWLGLRKDPMYTHSHTHIHSGRVFDNVRWPTTKWHLKWLLRSNRLAEIFWIDPTSKQLVKLSFRRLLLWSWISSAHKRQPLGPNLVGSKGLMPHHGMAPKGLDTGRKPTFGAS